MHCTFRSTSKSLIFFQPKTIDKYLLSHSCHMSRPSPPLYYRSNKLWPSVQIKQVLVMTSALPSCYFLTSSLSDALTSLNSHYLTSPVSVLPLKQHSHYTRRHKFNPTTPHSMPSSKPVQHCRTDGRTTPHTDQTCHCTTTSTEQRPS